MDVVHADWISCCLHLDGCHAFSLTLLPQRADDEDTAPVS